MADKKYILFVDDEPNLLQGLRRMLRPMRHEWDMTFVESGEAALAHLQHHPIDVVVSDMRMPGMDGGRLLGEVKTQYPHAVRLLLSGQTEQEGVLRSLGPVHRFLSKPCDAETLQQAIHGACQLRRLLQDSSLIKMVGQIESLPSLPSLYEEVMKEMNSPSASLEKVGKVIEQDPSMTAKILQLVNSSFFGMSKPIPSVSQAATVLGLDLLRALILHAHVFTVLADKPDGLFSMEAMWTHSVKVAALARKVAAEESVDRWVIENASTAGLLHNLGLLILITTFPQQYEEIARLVHEQGLPHWEAERRILGAGHPEVGAYLFGLWGLPDSIVEAVAFHHMPGECERQCVSPLLAVHIADALEKGGPKQMGFFMNSVLDWDYLRALGLEDRVSHWETLCQEGVPAGT